MSDATDTVTRLFAAWNSGDPEIDRLASPDLRFHGDPMHLSIPQGPVLFSRIRDGVPGTLHLSVSELIELEDDRVLILGVGDLVSEKGSFAQELGWIATVRGGLVIAATVYPDRATAQRAAGVR